jgi:hypothetical protein
VSTNFNKKMNIFLSSQQEVECIIPFKVSCLTLKKLIQQKVKISNIPQPLDDEGHVILILEHNLATREKKFRNKVFLLYIVGGRI